jgi:hypothetical protein
VEHQSARRLNGVPSQFYPALIFFSHLAWSSNWRTRIVCPPCSSPDIGRGCFGGLLTMWQGFKGAKPADLPVALHMSAHGTFRKCRKAATMSAKRPRCAVVYCPLFDCPRFALSSSALTDHPREWAMSRSRKMLQASSCATAMYSSALCACSIEPGPITTAGMPAKAYSPASVP